MHTILKLYSLIIFVNNCYGFLHTNRFIKNKILEEQSAEQMKVQQEFGIIPSINMQQSKEPKEPKESKHEFHYFGSFPRLESPNDKGQLTWYPIGFASDFSKKPTRITIRDVNYVVWKDKDMYYGMRDVCSHQGSSFMLGKVCKNTISCPYHGYIFDGSNGELIQIPKLPHVPLQNETMKTLIDESSIFVEPEFNDKKQRAVYLDEDFEHHAKFVSVNSLDICHIGFVHTFGNKKSPNPLHNSKIMKIDDYENHHKIVYQYMAGENSLVNKIYKFDNITVENEYALPHTTVARVKFGTMTSTIITHALPISTFKTKLFVKAYRSYWSYYHEKNTMYLLHPLESIINYFGDKLTYNTMYTTLKQDKEIVDNIDKTSYEGMHGKFSIVYDMFSNHYKNNYKMFYDHPPL
jgi:phenylpropionate dioxygenase-like ring-hydroxylating dioxygenase large terminal subunit